MTRRLGAVLVAALVLLAGCAGAGGPATGGTDAGESGGTTDAAGTAGTVEFYLSDERNDIDDFRHLNVTVSRVGFRNESGNWTEYPVDDRTVDLTRLQGANATRIANFSVPNDTYTKVFVYVSEVNGTLVDGSDQRVKLPSGKLQLNQKFTVGANESVDFVFDITVRKAGKSGKYVLQPVATESGTDVPIEERDGGDDDREERDDADDEPEADLNASLSGNVTPGGTATVTVTRGGSPVANATVVVNGDAAGRTDANGTLSFTVPEAESLSVTVEKGDAEAELEREFESEDDGQTGNRSDGGNRSA
ncbi:MAG: DUF4382 domain-containing protein [Haloferacaceae archaeon]